MSRPRRIRKAIFSTLWLAIGVVTAVSLAVMAFRGGGGGLADDDLVPTGSAEAEVVTVERGSVENELSVDVTVTLNKPVPVKASETGELTHRAVRGGESVRKGARLYQLKVPVAAQSVEQPEAQVPPAQGQSAADPAEAAPEPRFRYVDALAPADGVVQFSAELGSAVEKGQELAQISPGTFTATGAIEPVDRYRLQKGPTEAKVTIARGPAPFTCTNLRAAAVAVASDPAQGEVPNGSPEAPPQGDASGGASTDVSCDVPAGVTVFDGLKGTMTIDIGARADVLTVPVSAVRGLVQSGTVWLPAADSGGEPTERAVELGATNGEVVEVVKGLAEGDTVLRYVPGVKNAPQGDSSGDGSMGDMGSG